MVCYHCGCQLSEQDYCTSCGADVSLYKKILGLSNHYYNVGLAKAKVRDLTGAIDSLEQSLKYNSRNVEARNLLGLVFYEVGESTEAMSQWILSMNVEPKKNIASDYIQRIQNNPSRYDVIRQTMKKFNQALAYCEQGSKDLAVIQLKKVLSLSPRFVKAHMLLALLHIDNEDWEKARRELNKTLGIDRGNTQALLYMQEVDRMLAPDDIEKNDKKRKKEETVRYQSDNEVIIQPTNLADGTRSGFSTVLNIIVGLVIGAAAMYFLVLPANQKAAQNEAQERVESIAGQLDSKTNQIQQLENMVNTLENAKAKLEEDLDAYEGTEGKLKEMDQLFVAASTYLSTKDVGLTAERLDHVRENVKIEEASEEFQGLYNALLALIGPELAKTYHEAGYVAFRNEDFKAAIDNYLKAVYYDPNNAEALFDLGNAYRRDGDSVNAVTIFNRVIELFPETDTARKAKQFLVDYDAGETE
ncbi:MAG: tetratricopeptide repeat protein [Lachnospiraceae bacterium]|jgi:tetratricopeptide (TPR) repeat protein|nr:tetratricopeptide repeat protein [Lachnospiraceae bacterium]MBR3508724.1 tetratricopeptide repeat protein [Lachnospiraceae bacterium]MBR4606582.1 tetratricopeptide repeat protein [Lachnospiraceae bacterium]MBR6149928.1 tetratricopeptide repeat protein [Lachnospiraceae bacterium]